MRLIRALLACALLFSMQAVVAAPSAPAGAAEQPAVWRHHDLILSLSKLPRPYSCDDLWYKLHDLLLALGARPDMKILVYDCGKAAGAQARSPQIHLQFSTPEALPQSQTRWAEIEATPKTVQISPGQPATLHDGDCELIQQIKDGLLPELTQRIVSFDLACAAPRPSHWAFNVTVQALIPAATGPRPVVRAGR